MKNIMLLKVRRRTNKLVSEVNEEKDFEENMPREATSFDHALKACNR